MKGWKMEKHVCVCMFVWWMYVCLSVFVWVWTTSILQLVFGQILVIKKGNNMFFAYIAKSPKEFTYFNVDHTFSFQEVEKSRIFEANL